jgi:mono/diheme cytochrome c family protein
MSARSIAAMQRGRLRKRMLALLVVIALVVIAGLWLLGGPGPTGFSKGPKVALGQYTGKDPTGVPAGLASESLVKRGEYLAKAADCVVCHTAHGGQPFAGGLAFPLPFGTIYSTNITPDSASGIGAYTDQQFLDAVRRGVRRDGARLYPAMPYPSYAYLSDADVLAIKAYLLALQPVSAPDMASTLGFPFNQRFLLALWSGLFSANERFRPDTSRSPEWNRGAYLAEALEHCGECHTPRNLAFALDERRKFGGALTGGWNAYNISSDRATGIGAWSDDELISYLSVGHAAGRGSASGPMGEVVGASLSQLDPADIRALAAYVRSVPGVSSAELPGTIAAAATFSHRDGGGAANATGKQVFEGACAGCHGWSGISPLSAVADLTGARAVNDPHATNVVQIVLAGEDRSSGPDTLHMPAFGGSYSDNEVAAVANYVTARFGSQGSSLDAHNVELLRAQSVR